MSLPISNFDNVCDELTVIALHLSINDILNLCLVNVKFYRSLWDNNNFWLSKFTFDIGIVTQTQTVKSNYSWRQLYLNSFNVWVIGENIYSKLGVLHNKLTKFTQIPKFKAIQIASSDCHTIALDLNNNIHVWGGNEYGELGLGDKIDRQQPTLLPNIKCKFATCGLNVSFVIDLDDNLWGFGGMDHLGLDNSGTREFPTDDDINKPILHPRLIVPFKVKEASSGWAFTVVKDYNDNIWGWGSNIYGQLGNNKEYHFIPVQLTDIKAKQVSAGSYHTFIIDYNDNVWACGQNSHGQLGLGTTSNVFAFTQIKGIKAKKVICGDTASAIINFDNELFMFGNNRYGQLGLGDTADRVVPTKVPNIKVKEVSLTSDEDSILLDINGDVWICGRDINKPIPQRFDKSNLLLTPTLLPSIKGRNILTLAHASIITGVKFE